MKWFCVLVLAVLLVGPFAMGGDKCKKTIADPRGEFYTGPIAGSERFWLRRVPGRDCYYFDDKQSDVLQAVRSWAAVDRLIAEALSKKKGKPAKFYQFPNDRFERRDTENQGYFYDKGTGRVHTYSSEEDLESRVRAIMRTRLQRHWRFPTAR